MVSPATTRASRIPARDCIVSPILPACIHPARQGSPSACRHVSCGDLIPTQLVRITTQRLGLVGLGVNREGETNCWLTGDTPRAQWGCFAKPVRERSSRQ